MKETQSAGGVIQNLQGHILVVSQHGTSWSLPKGHIEVGEEKLEAAKREIYEETGITDLKYIQDLGSYWRYKISKNGGEDTSEKKTIFFYHFSTTQIELSPVDSDNPEARWVPKDEVANLLTAQKDKDFFISIVDKITNKVPDIIREVGFDFSWDSEDVWKLDYPTEEISIDELTWHFDIPFWDSEGTDEYNLKPWDLIHNPEKEPTHMDHINKADMKYPIDIMENKGRWVILDGLHRLVKAYLASMDTVQVRKIPRSEITNISKG